MVLIFTYVSISNITDNFRVSKKFSFMVKTDCMQSQLEKLIGHDALEVEIKIIKEIYTFKEQSQELLSSVLR